MLRHTIDCSISWLVLFSATALLVYSQSTPATVTPSTSVNPSYYIDGAKEPNLIPDNVAYRFVILSLSLGVQPTETQVRKQNIRIQRLHLTRVDERSLRNVLVDFSSDYYSWLDGLNSRTPDVAERDGFFANCRIRLKQALTPAGLLAFDTYVQGEKAKMITAK